MVVQTRFFSYRFSISHAKQRPTTAPRRAARVRAAAFRRAHGPTLGSRRHKMRVQRQHKASTALTSSTENPVSGAYRLEFFPNGDRLKGRQNCQSSFL
jgi:hypothetical protein